LPHFLVDESISVFKEELGAPSWQENEKGQQSKAHENSEEMLLEMHLDAKLNCELKIND